MVAIAVHGSASRLVDAEAATVRLQIQVHADDRATALKECVAAQRDLTAALEALRDHGHVAQWSSTRVMTFIDWHQDKGEAQARSMQSAQASVRAEFQDLGVVGDWVAQVAENELVRVEGIDWTVTDGTRIDVERALRVEAVAEAMRRATDYAESLGMTPVEVVALWEPGLRPGRAGAEGPQRKSRLFAASAGEGGFDLRAEPIELMAEISLDVTARAADDVAR